MAPLLRLLATIALVLCLVPGAPGRAQAQDGPLLLDAPEEAAGNGFLKYILPRFSLKYQIRVTHAPGDPAAHLHLAPGAEGPAVFRGGDVTWHLAVRSDDERAGEFARWLRSDVGRRTIEAFAPDGTPLYTASLDDAAADEALVFEGDARVGEELSILLCGRCHVVSEANRMNAIGSTPSFMVLRTFADWDARFAAFYALNPHPAFTQVQDVTDPFPIDRPSPIFPLTLDLDQLEAIMAYVAALNPADLGAPIQHQ